MDLRFCRHWRTPRCLALLEIICEKRSSAMRPQTITALLEEASEDLEAWIAESRERTIGALRDKGATDIELDAVAAWLDDEHGRWMDEALADLRERLIDGGTAYTRH
jgi:hypothetical protein